VRLLDIIISKITTTNKNNNIICYYITYITNNREKNREFRALSEGGGERAYPPSGTAKKNINNEAYVIRLHRIPTLGKELEA
jgi:hypothetical protein